jgi:hypothetical protein
VNEKDGIGPATSSLGKSNAIENKMHRVQRCESLRDESANGAMGSLVFDNDKYIGLMITKPIEPWARREPILLAFESDATGTLSRHLYHLESLAFLKPKFFCVQIS